MHEGAGAGGIGCQTSDEGPYPIVWPRYPGRAAGDGTGASGRLLTGPRAASLFECVMQQAAGNNTRALLPTSSAEGGRARHSSLRFGKQPTTSELTGDSLKNTSPHLAPTSLLSLSITAVTLSD
jgi:hypothetical protein